jgi:hypothetical protein
MTLATFVRRFLPGAPPETTDRPLFPPASPEVLEYGKSPACLAAVEAVNAIVFDTLPKEPKVNPSLVEQRQIMLSAGLRWQARYCEHQMRLDACKVLGLPVYDDQQAADLLAGCPTKAAGPRHWRPIGYSSVRFSDHFDSTDMKSDDTSSAQLLASRLELKRETPTPVVYNSHRAFDVPHQERICLGDLGDLRYPISLGAVLRYQIAKEFRCAGQSLFQGFAIMAPESCWAVPEKKDPLLFGVILGPINRKTRCFEDRFALLARWE